jgi:hypothetical protein
MALFAGFAISSIARTIVRMNWRGVRILVKYTQIDSSANIASSGDLGTKNRQNKRRDIRKHHLRQKYRDQLLIDIFEIVYSCFG